MTASTAAPGSLRSGWRALRASPDRILVPTIALSVPAIALHVLLQQLVGVGVAGSRECPRVFLGTRLLAACGPTNGRAQLALLVGLFAFFVVGHLVVAGLYRVALDVVDGLPARGPFQGWSIVGVLPAALVLGAILTVATLVLALPGLILGFFTRYAMLFVVDRGLGTFAAIGATFELVATRLASELGFVLAATAVLLAGLLLLGIGLYVAIPVVLVAQAYRYRAANPAR